MERHYCNITTAYSNFMDMQLFALDNAAHEAGTLSPDFELTSPLFFNMDQGVTPPVQTPTPLSTNQAQPHSSIHLIPIQVESKKPEMRVERESHEPGMTLTTTDVNITVTPATTPSSTSEPTSEQDLQTLSYTEWSSGAQDDPNTCSVQQNMEKLPQATEHCVTPVAVISDALDLRMSGAYDNQSLETEEPSDLNWAENYSYSKKSENQSPESENNFLVDMQQKVSSTAHDSPEYLSEYDSPCANNYNQTGTSGQSDSQSSTEKIPVTPIPHVITDEAYPVDTGSESECQLEKKPSKRQKRFSRSHKDSKRRDMERRLKECVPLLDDAEMASLDGTPEVTSKHTWNTPSGRKRKGYLEVPMEHEQQNGILPHDLQQHFEDKDAPRSWMYPDRHDSDMTEKLICQTLADDVRQQSTKRQLEYIPLKEIRSDSKSESEKGDGQKYSLSIPEKITEICKKSKQQPNSCQLQSDASLPNSTRPSLSLFIPLDYITLKRHAIQGDTSCPGWSSLCPCVSKPHDHSNQDLCEMSGERLGILESEIDKRTSNSGFNSLVSNYARMLENDIDQFVETLFRAVKLNNTSVFQILYNIVKQSGLHLSDPEMRERESSATVLHVAIMYNHVGLVDFLLQTQDTELVLARYTMEDYRNQTSLHVAVSNGNAQLVLKLLMSLDTLGRQELINTVADGKYFRKQHIHGQLCLTAAAWVGNQDIIEALVCNGADLGLKNHEGNTFLHSIVQQSLQYMERTDYPDIINRFWKAIGILASRQVFDTRNQNQKLLEQGKIQVHMFHELMKIRNNDGYTALAMAASLDSSLFHYFINMEKVYKIPQNKLGSIAWVTYDVSDIASFANSNYNKFSVLHILAHMSKRLSRHANLDVDMDDDGDYLDREPCQSLLACKWRVYRWVYIGWFIVHTLYMLVFTAATAETNSSPEMGKTRAGDQIFETPSSEVKLHYVGFLILPCVYLILETLDSFGILPYRIQFMSGQNYFVRIVKCIKSQWTITGNGPYRLVNYGFAMFACGWFWMYLTKDKNQDIALSMTLLLGWIFVLFFTRACRVTCRFAIMIQKMFFRDLIYFLTVYGIVLVAFSFAMNAMFTYLRHWEVTINTVFYDMMNVVTDLDTKQSVDKARHPLFARLLLILYAIMAVILLMNMLIAMMNTSYETVRVTRCNLWKQQQLSILLMIERRFFWFKWLGNKSESEIWQKDTPDGIRSYLDVTVLKTPCST